MPSKKLRDRFYSFVGQSLILYLFFYIFWLSPINTMVIETVPIGMSIMGENGDKLHDKSHFSIVFHNGLLMFSEKSDEPPGHRASVYHINDNKLKIFENSDVKEAKLVKTYRGFLVRLSPENELKFYLKSAELYTPNEVVVLTYDMEKGEIINE